MYSKTLVAFFNINRRIISRFKDQDKIVNNTNNSST